MEAQWKAWHRQSNAPGWKASGVCDALTASLAIQEGSALAEGEHEDVSFYIDSLGQHRISLTNYGLPARTDSKAYHDLVSRAAFSFAARSTLTSSW